MGEIRQPFTDDELIKVQHELELLATHLSQIPGSNVEEYHWAGVYRRAKGLPEGTWSNLPFRDYLHDGIGVEWKLLKRKSPARDQGGYLMHPSASRKVDFDPLGDANVAKDMVLNQWTATIDGFRREVAATRPGAEPDLRWGVLLWKEDYRQFLYFEEEVVAPDPSAFRGVWADGNHRGNSTRNLHIYERATGKKRFSVTLPNKGAKLQPYFDVPTVAQGACLFDVPEAALRRPVWLTRELYDELKLEDVAAADHDQWLRDRLGLPALDA